MASPVGSGASQGELDALELMMERMNRDSSSRSSSPSPAFPPPRTSSRASDRTRLSTHSSNQSLHSLHSFHARSPRPASPLVGRASSDAGDRDEDEDETTPSMRQSEWGRRTMNHARARTTSDNRGLHRNYDEDTNSLRSSTRPTTADDDATSFNSFYPSSSAGARWSPQTSPRPRPRQAPAVVSTPPLNLHQAGPSQSPLRLLPRSPLNDRTPLEDLTFFREVGAFSLDNEETWTSTMGDSSRDHDTSSVRSGTSSIRNARLREDIEKTAQQIKDRANSEETPPPAATSSPRAPPPDSPESVLTRRGSNGFASSLPLYPGAPSPAPAQMAPPEYSDYLADSRSVRSVVSGTDSTASYGGTWPSPSMAASARMEYAAVRGERPERTRQKESKEWSQSCWVWIKDTSPTLSSGGKFSKAPLIRDVPSALKRKSGKRDSAHQLSPAEAMLFNFDDPSAGSSKSSKSTASKDKDKAKGKAPIGPVAGGRNGTWRKSTGVLRDDGYFRVFGESDKIVIHSIYLPSYNRTDVRPVDHTLFGRPNCVSISHRSASPATPQRTSFQSQPMAPSLSADSTRPLEDPVYLCFPSVVATQVWLVMAHCFARPEYYLASGAATPRPLKKGRSSDPSWPSSDEGDVTDHERASELDKSCRIYRRLHLAINEGRSLGEAMTESTRPGAKTSWDRPGMYREGSGPGDASTSTDLRSPGSVDSPSKSINMASALPNSRSRTGGDGKDDQSGVEWFCEIEMDGEVVARTALRKGHSPFWNETFTFSDLPPFTSPLIIRVLQSSKSSSRLHILGSATVRLADLPRHDLYEDWWSIKPANLSKVSDVVGELNLGVRIGEEVVLPSREYETLLNFLTGDNDAELATELALEFPSDLEEVTTILMRIYQAESILVPRLLRLADLEIDSNNRLNRASAILFRGNTILTKSVELYLRLIGAEYLEASIGEIIRKIVKDKVEIEIDPSKLKPGWKDKELAANVAALHEWTTALWNSIYDAREKCPQDLRQIFGHIQRIVVEKYGQGEDQKNTRWTSVSAFIFLRFFVPAVLNPRLFFIVSAPPDAKSQRTLTLIAKTLQGLANFSSFGQKEPWMLPMNSFVQDNGAAFVDFIEHVATPAPPHAYRQEWTSALASTYLAPYRLRNSLSPLEKEGVALLPHLIDLPRELGLLATHLARWSAEKAAHDRDGSVGTGRSETSSVLSGSASGSQRLNELAEVCVEVYDESRRRGGGLISAPSYYELRSKQPNLRTRAASRMAGRPGTASGPSSAPSRVKSPVAPVTRPTTASTSDELHIRNPSRPVTPPAPATRVARPQSVDLPGRSSTASRRSHRSFTINGATPGHTVVSNGVLTSISNEDLALLASIQTAPSTGSMDGGRENATSPVAPPSMDHLAAFFEKTRCVTADDDSDAPTDDDPLFDAEEDRPAPSRYDFPPVTSSTMSRALSSPTAPSVPMVKSASTHSSSTASTISRAQPRPPTTSRIRITQETTTTSSHISELMPTAAPLGTSVHVSASPLDALGLHPAPHSPALPGSGPYESEFGSGPSSYVASPMRSPVGSTNSSPLIGTKSATMGGLPTSTSAMSISAEVSASMSALVGRRASSAGIMAGFGLGKSASRNGSGSTGGGDDEASSSGGSSGKGGLLSRAMGRKGSRAS
ncbi:hypothetical protein JCM10212_001246 [Sporobolomyces blumeae]